MKKFFNSYRIIALAVIIGFISNGVLYYYKILTNKEYFVIFGGIILLSTISYLINYIIDMSKITNMLKQHTFILTRTIVDSIMINNYLTNMCLKGYNYINHKGWKHEWLEFVKSMKKTKNINNKNMKTPFNVDSIEELKRNLKHFENQEKFEECGKILEKIKRLEDNKQ